MYAVTKLIDTDLSFVIFNARFEAKAFLLNSFKEMLNERNIKMKRVEIDKVIDRILNGEVVEFDKLGITLYPCSYGFVKFELGEEVKL